MIGISKLSVYQSSSIIPLQKAALLVDRLKKKRKRVGLCHGGFDLLHPGQVKHFESAKKLCDVLVVSVTSDRYVAGRKGEGRPIFSDKLRAYMIANLRVVDYVVITDFKLGVDVIKKLKPTLYIKGPDFINKQTPGIIAERKAGNIAYTREPKLSTTEIIDYIQNKIPRREILVIIDRDGTLITNDGYFARDDSWRKKLTLNEPVVSFITYLQTKYKTTKIIASNQSGVGRGFFDEGRVREVNEAIHALLKKQGITIDHWQYCPDLDLSYAQKNPSTSYIKKYVKIVTKRKPSTAMVADALRDLKKTLRDFDHVIVIGDHEDDQGLAKNLSALFVDVRGKTYEELVAAL